MTPPLRSSWKDGESNPAHPTRPRGEGNHGFFPVVMDVTVAPADGGRVKWHLADSGTLPGLAARGVCLRTLSFRRSFPAVSFPGPVVGTGLSRLSSEASY